MNDNFPENMPFIMLKHGFFAGTMSFTMLRHEFFAGTTSFTMLRHEFFVGTTSFTMLKHEFILEEKGAVVGRKEIFIQVGNVFFEGVKVWLNILPDKFIF